MKKLMLSVLALVAVSAHAKKTTCTVIRASRGEALTRDFEVNMADAREHSHNNEIGVLQIDEKGVVSNLTDEMPGDEVQIRLKGKTLIQLQRAKEGYDQITLAKVTGKGDLPGIINGKAGDSAIGNLEGQSGLGISLTKLDLLAICKTTDSAK